MAPNTSLMALGTDKGGIFLYDPIKGTLIREFRNAHEGEILWLNWGSEGKQVSSSQKAVKVWNATDGKNLNTFSGTGIDRFAVAGNHTIVGRAGDSLVGLSLLDGTTRYSIPFGQLWTLAVNPEGTFDTKGSRVSYKYEDPKTYNKDIVSYNLETGTLEKRIRIPRSMGDVFQNGVFSI